MQLSKIKGITDATTIDLDFDGIMELICSHGYSGSTFRNNHRCLENFEKTNLVILDIDDGLTLSDAEARLSGHKHILALTRNHQKIKYTKAGKEKPACDRFRIVLFLDGTITNKEDYKHTCRQLLTMFPELDTSCSEASRFFYQSPNVHSYRSDGKLIAIEIAPEQVNTRTENTGKLGNLSAKTKDFLSNGAEEGTWNVRLFNAALDLNEQNYPQDVALTLLSAIDQPLDDSDMSTFESAYGREPKYSPRTNVMAIDGFDEHKQTEYQPEATEYEGLTIPFFDKNLRHWLDELFLHNNISLNKKDEITVNGKHLSFEFFRNTTYIATGEARRHKYDSRGEKVLDKFKKPVVTPTGIANRGVVDSYIAKWVDEEKMRILLETKNAISFVEGSGEVEKYVGVVCSRDQELTAAVVRQFIYNVKLKLNTVHPKFILMPVFVGNQGVGKSLAVRKLLEPISHMSTPTDFEVFRDERKFKGLFGEKLVLEFDEMSAARKADIEAVKNKITAERVNYRVLGTTQAVTMFNMSSMIGSSNSTLIDLLYDDTGKRRFYEVLCKTETFWEEIEGINSLAMWQSVDINADPPILPFLDQLNAAQSTYKNLNSAEEYLVDGDMIPKNLEDKTFKIKRDELYKQYADSMKLQSRHPFTKNKFYGKCRQLLEEISAGGGSSTFVVKEK